MLCVFISILVHIGALAPHRTLRLRVAGKPRCGWRTIPACVPRRAPPGSSFPRARQYVVVYAILSIPSKGPPMQKRRKEMEKKRLTEPPPESSHVNLRLRHTTTSPLFRYVRSSRTGMHGHLLHTTHVISNQKCRIASLHRLTC
ncbi:hypothetical protein EDB84DRAFT_1465266 [Lactarius hengduanensis]|nr:hypothetical protein EDB84DRAFT_1465266 [Lactarius hengduanensis]